MDDKSTVRQKNSKDDDFHCAAQSGKATDYKLTGYFLYNRFPDRPTVPA